MSSAEALQGMKPSELRAKGEDAGISKKDLDSVADEDDPKAALIDLILKNAPASPAELLAKMKPSELRTKAEDARISKKDLDSAADEADPKAALIKLILVAPTKRVPEPEPEPEPEGEPEPDGGGASHPAPAPAPSPSSHDQIQSGAFARTKTDQTMLNLVNKVQDINLASLGMTDNDTGNTLDWPQICVVGGQSEGKSTLLSAIVSANMSAKMDFLPEGKGMVTRCPISVQMTKTKGEDKHTATVSNQRDGGEAEEGTPGEGGSIAGPGADPTGEELKEWGIRIQQRITALQDNMVGPGQVTHKKIIVRLKGPKLPNLSLVDLPGLRSVDDDEHAGLKERLEAMVTDNLTSDSTIVLCVGPAWADPSTWVGRGLAKKVDPSEKRTIGVVTKTDKIFPSGVVTGDDLANQRQLKQVLDDARSTPYFAAYNMKPKDAKAYEDAGFDLKGTLEGYFEPGHVGNVAIMNNLEKRLSTHLELQLPELHKTFKKRLKILEAELQQSLEPTWYIVEQLMLSYSRLVQGYCEKNDDPEEVVSHRGLQGTTPDGKKIWGHEQNFQGLLVQLLKDFAAKVKPGATYQDAGAKASILFRSTADVLKEVQDKRMQYDKVGEHDITWVEEPGNWLKDDVIGHMLGRTLTGDLQGMCNDVLSGIEEGTEDVDGLYPLCKDFFEAICEVEFELEELNDATFRINEFPLIKKELLKSTTSRLDWNWAKVKNKAKEQSAVPTLSVVNAKFMKIDEVQAALMRVCAFAKDPNGRHPWLRKGGGGGDLSRTTTVTVDDAALDTRDPPSGMCAKQKDGFKVRWPTYFAKIEPTGAPTGHGLSFYAEQVDPNSKRGSSVADVTGCNFMKSREPFVLQGDWHKITMFGENLVPQYVHFAFQDEDKCDAFLDALENLGARRPWNLSAAQHAAEERKRLEREAREAETAEHRRKEEVRQEELQRLKDEQAAAGAQQATEEPEVQAAFARKDLLLLTDEIWALEGDASITKVKTDRGRLFLYGSQVFVDFYTALKATPLAFGDDQIDQEVNAESYRLWALMAVRVRTELQIESVSSEMRARFFTYSNATCPFSTSSIFGKVGLSKMVTAYERSEYGVDDHRRPNGPEKLLQQDDGVKDREKKQLQMSTLKDLCRQFEASGLSPC